jgi:hypothetical protein
MYELKVFLIWLYIMQLFLVWVKWDDNGFTTKKELNINLIPYSFLFLLAKKIYSEYKNLK